MEQDPGYLDGVGTRTPVIADIQQLAEVLAVPIQILFGVTCWRCEDQGFLGQSKANRIERILETILRPFDLSNPVGRKRGLRGLRRLCGPYFRQSPDYHPLVWAAADRLGQDKIIKRRACPRAS